MTQWNKWRPTLERRRSRVGFRGLAAFLTPPLLFYLSFVTPSGKAHCRTGDLIRQSTQEPAGAGKSQNTKAAPGQAPSSKLPHIATQSFFLENQQLTSAGEREAQALSDDTERALQQLEGGGVHTERSLLRSGLALAGANEHKENDNGILTALAGTQVMTSGRCRTKRRGS